MKGVSILLITGLLLWGSAARAEVDEPSLYFSVNPGLSKYSGLGDDDMPFSLGFNAGAITAFNLGFGGFFTFLDSVSSTVTGVGTLDEGISTFGVDLAYYVRKSSVSFWGGIRQGVLLYSSTVSPTYVSSSSTYYMVGPIFGFSYKFAERLCFGPSVSWLTTLKRTPNITRVDPRLEIRLEF